MKLRIGSRKSALARQQAYEVGSALLTCWRKRQRENLEIDYIFKSSFGDENLDRPLTQMPDKGVFTQDLTEDLRNGTLDLVVHSWKDLPTEMPKDTQVMATLPRADQRDLLIVKKSSLAKIAAKKQMHILTSSPRRVYNLAAFLPWALPFAEVEITFGEIRGNIPTRLSRIFGAEEADGLVVAKAAVDRLFRLEHPDLLETKKNLESLKAQIVWMVLPMKECPPAAAQGALAVETLQNRSDLRELLSDINCPATYECAKKERDFLASKGGGCHQKIGVSYFPHPNGTVFSTRGRTDTGEILNSWRFDERRSAGGELQTFFPHSPEEGRLLKTVSVPYDQNRIEKAPMIWLSKGTAWPEAIPARSDRVLWVAGLETWKTMAKKGHWVCGSCEGLGDSLTADLTSLVGPKAQWLKLTHVGAIDFGQHPAIGTYALVTDPKVDFDVNGVTHFYWSSYSNFEEALLRSPQIRYAQHACGPGRSAELIRAALGADAYKLQVFISYEEWREALK